jgi:hypothetical protein
VISKISGDGQTGTAGRALRYPLVVAVTNVDGIPVAGVNVTFTVTAGAGSLSAVQAVTDDQGVALATLGLGPALGTNSVSATAVGLTGSPLTFAASAVNVKKRPGQLVSQ